MIYGYWYGPLPSWALKVQHGPICVIYLHKHAVLLIFPSLRPVCVHISQRNYIRDNVDRLLLVSWRIWSTGGTTIRTASRHRSERSLPWRSASRTELNLTEWVDCKYYAEPSLPRGVFKSMAFLPTDLRAAASYTASSISSPRNSRNNPKLLEQWQQ